MRIRFMSLFALPLLACGVLHAQTMDRVDTERENLVRIQYELTQLKVQVEEAARNAPNGGRVQFRYDWLASDLDQIARSIQDHLDAPRQPRQIPPLKGDYRN